MIKLEIDKVRRELYGSRSKRKARLLEQIKLQLEELKNPTRGCLRNGAIHTPPTEGPSGYL